MKPLSILVVDDHSLVRTGLIHTLQSENLWPYQFLEACNGKEAVELLLKHEVDIIFLDIQMPQMNGYQATANLLSLKPDSKVIILSEHDELSVILHFLKKGVKGFLAKDCDSHTIHHALRSVLLGDIYYHSQFKSQIDFWIRNPDGFVSYHKFTKREKQLIRLMSEGKSNQEIAEDLNISVRSVEDYRYNLINKTNVKNSIQLMHYANKSGLI